MSKTTVVHVRDVDLADPGVVYIGRAMPRFRIKGSRWGNPFRAGPKVCMRTVLTDYADYILELLEPDALQVTKGEPCVLNLDELRGKRLACWCKGKKDARCHGDILAALADGATPKQVYDMIERGSEHVDGCCVASV
jgi:hypothetical protein